MTLVGWTSEVQLVDWNLFCSCDTVWRSGSVGNQIRSFPLLAIRNEPELPKEDVWCDHSRQAAISAWSFAWGLLTCCFDVTRARLHVFVMQGILTIDSQLMRNIWMLSHLLAYQRTINESLTQRRRKPQTRGVKRFCFVFVRETSQTRKPN